MVRMVLGRCNSEQLVKPYTVLVNKKQAEIVSISVQAHMPSARLENDMFFLQKKNDIRHDEFGSVLPFKELSYVEKLQFWRCLHCVSQEGGISDGRI